MLRYYYQFGDGDDGLKTAVSIRHKINRLKRAMNSHIASALLDGSVLEIFIVRTSQRIRKI